MRVVKSGFSVAASVAAFILAGASVASAQVVAPAPVLTSEAKDNTCGWGLGGAAAGLGVAALLGSGAKAPAANWSGLYIGGHLGCAIADTNWTFQNATAFSNTGNTAAFNNNGMIGGGQIGYNFQSGNWVFGIEASLSGGDLGDQRLNSPNPLPAVNSTRYSSDIRWLFQATPRLGYAFGPNLHAYIKGGYATAQVDTSLFGASAAATLQLASNQRHDGWTVGTGIEYMLASGVILGLDYSYVNLDSSTRTVSCLPTGCGGTQTVYNVDPGEIHMITGRISFKIGGDQRAAAPLK